MHYHMITIKPTTLLLGETLYLRNSKSRKVYKPPTRNHKETWVWRHVKILPYSTIPTDAHYVRTKFQRFVSDQPRSFFKKLIVSTRRLLHNLHTMSLAKAAPDSLKDRECKKMALREPLAKAAPDSLKDCECKKMASPEPLRFHMYQKQRYVRSHEFLYGTLVRAWLFSLMWDLPKKRLRRREF